jgi:hypothetical protein
MSNAAVLRKNLLFSAESVTGKEFDTVGIYYSEIFKILAYFKNHNFSLQHQRELLPDKYLLVMALLHYSANSVRGKH